MRAETSWQAQLTERLIEAAEHASRVFAHEEAARLYERASNLMMRGPTLSGPAANAIDLQSRRAEALHLAGDPSAAGDVIRAAIDKLDDGDPLRAAVMTERLATYLWDAGDEPGALVGCSTGCERGTGRTSQRSPGACPASQARLLMLANYNTEALALCEPALDAGRAAAAGQILAGILITQATLIGRSEPRRGLAMLEDARRFAEDIDDVSQMLRADNNLSILLDDLREFDRAQEVMARAIRTAANAGLERTRGAVAYVNAASFALWASQPSRAIELASHAIELTRSGDTLSFAYGARGNAKIHMGELADGSLGSLPPHGRQRLGGPPPTR